MFITENSVVLTLQIVLSLKKDKSVTRQGGITLKKISVLRSVLLFPHSKVHMVFFSNRFLPKLTLADNCWFDSIKCSAKHVDSTCRFAS